MKLRYWIGGCGVALGGLCAPTASTAQNKASTSKVAAAPPSSDGAEIVVTATKRGAASVINIPVSIQAFDSATLERRNALEFSDFSRSVAGLSTFDQGTGNKRYVLRGVSSAGAGTVGVYVDEIVITGENSQGYAGLQADPRLFDIDRIEVLKGPQGTTFGSSALSGVIRYITNKPNLNEFGGKTRAAVTDQHLAGLGANGDVTLNIPLVKGIAAARGTLFYLYRPGYISNRYGSNQNKENTFSGRGQLRVRPIDALTLDLFYQHQFSDAGLGYYNLTDFFGNPVPKRYFQSAPERVGMKDRLDLYNATLNYDTGVGTVTASASHTERKIEYNRPATQVIAAATRRPVTDPNIRSLIAHPRLNKVDSYELRFASQWGGPIGILAGAYYQKDTRDFASRILTVDDLGHIDPVGGIFGPILQDRTLFTTIEEKALFTEATWDVTDKFQLIAGGRAFKFDNFSQSDARIGIVARIPGRPGTGLGPASRTTESNVIGRVIASYNFAPRTKIYAQIAQGYRPGGTNDQAAAALGGATVPEGFKSDKLVNYEIGFKHQTPDRRFSIATAAYYVDWRDIQLVLKTSPAATGTQFAYTGNAGRAAIYGGEIEATARPVRPLTLGATLSYTNGTVRETIPGAGVKGERIPYTPYWSATGSADYEFKIGNRDAYVGADLAYIGNRYTDFAANTGFYFKLKPYTVANVRAGVSMGPTRVAVVVKNIFENSTVTDYFIQTVGVSLYGYYRVPPRTASLEISRNF
jgi:outer membrane receptor protein involved in Fe transport